jgi:hypothetical protein
MSTAAILIIGCCLITLILAGVGVYFYINRKIDCKVGEWGACSKTCGGGVKTRTVITEPKNGGVSCGMLTQSCNTQLCGITPPPPPTGGTSTPVCGNKITPRRITPRFVGNTITDQNVEILSENWWSGTEFVNDFNHPSNQNIRKTIDGNLTTLYNPQKLKVGTDGISRPQDFPKDLSDTSQETTMQYKFDKLYNITKVVIKSGIYVPGYTEDWSQCKLSFNGQTSSMDKIILNNRTTLSENNETITTNTLENINICTDKLTFTFNNSGRVREIEFWSDSL